MTTTALTQPLNRNAALQSGWLYLMMGFTTGFGIMYPLVGLLVIDDPVTTASLIRENHNILNLSIVGNLAGQICFIFLSTSLRDLFKQVNERLANQMVMLVLVSIPLTFLNSLNLVGAELTAARPEYLKGFTDVQLDSLSYTFMVLFKYGISIVGVFWGLWLLPFGRLAYQSTFMPKFIGLFLVVGCFSYLLSSLSELLFPAIAEITSSVLMIPLAIGEFSVIGWLIYAGLRK